MFVSKPYSFSYFFVFAFILLTLPSATQTTISGRIVDLSTGNEVPYVPIVYNVSHGAVADSLGYFSINEKFAVQEIKINLFNYKPLTINLAALKSTTDMVIRIEPESKNLNAVSIKPSKRKKREIDTLALYVIGQVLEHKKENNPQHIESYRLNEYTKLVLGVQNMKPKLIQSPIIRSFDFFFHSPDSSESGNLRYPLLIQEEFNHTYHQASPQINRKEILYRKISGLKGGYLPNLAADYFKNIDLYDNVFDIGQLSFTSPFTSMGRGVYRYFIMDTLSIDGATTYELAFVGKNKADVAIKGYAMVDSATWGIRSIRFKPNEKANINYITDYSIEQKYKYVDNHWLLAEEKLDITANAFESKKGLSVHIKKLSVNDSIQTNIKIPDDIKQANSDKIADAFNKPLAYIDSLRISPLATNEKHIYWAYDTAKTIPAYKRMQWVAHLAKTGNLKAGPIDFGRVDEIFSRNATEGYRIKFGIHTNESLSKNVFYSTYSALSLQTKNFSVGNELSVRFNTKNDRYIRFSAIDKHDMLDLGREDALIGFDHMFTLLMPYKNLNKVIPYYKSGFDTEWDWFKGLSSTFQFNRSRYYSFDDTFTFLDENENPIYSSDNRLYGLGAYGVSEFSAGLRFSKNSQYIERGIKRKFIASKFPVIGFKYTQAVKGLLGGNFNYSKFEMEFKHTLRMPIVGFAEINLKGGYSVGRMPFTSAFAAPGNPGFIKDNNSFELLRPFEFLHDKYVSLFYEHHFQGLLLNKIPYINKAKLREFISVKMLTGGVSALNKNMLNIFPETHSSSTVPYIEFGAGIENIAKIFQVSFHCRATYWNSVGAENFSVKLGIRPGF